MSRIMSVLSVTVAVTALIAPRSALAQAQDHAHEPGTEAHSHVGAAVSCETLATPPWAGLPDMDRLKMTALRQEITALSTPELAIAAGFRPALGDIPGMGVHYVNLARSRDGVDINAPDHLMFAEMDGTDKLVGAAYAFVDVPNTDEPIPFESDLATWHDHPRLAPDGQTLHMLHIWFIPSSNGPFAGLNFWLPYRTAGVAIPSSCWMADDADALRIQTVSFALVPPRRFGLQTGRQAEAEAPSPERMEMIAALDAAAIAVDHDAWVAAADRFIADLSDSERTRVQGRLGNLGANQMSSAERDAAGIAQDANDDRLGDFEERIEEFQTRLNLTDDQLDDMRPVMAESFEKILLALDDAGLEQGGGRESLSRRDRIRLGRQIRDIQEETDKEIREILDGDEMEEYEKIQEERREQLRARSQGGGADQ